MLAGMGANFLYTAISRCKAPPDGFPYIIYIVMPEPALSPRSLFLARERGPVKWRSKKFVIRLIR